MSWIKQIKSLVSRRNMLISVVGIFVLGLMFYRLGGLTSGVSSSELKAVNFGLGWHGLAANTLFFPLQLIRSAMFFTISNQHVFIARLPNAIFGLMGVVSYALVVRAWHDTRTAILASLMFATSAWTLHVSRIASFDVLFKKPLSILRSQ